MTTPAIVDKLTAELENGITTEPQVVHLLAALRKLMERDGLNDQYQYLDRNGRTGSIFVINSYAKDEESE